MSKFVIVERGEVYEDHCAVTWTRDVFCEEQNIGVSFLYDDEYNAWSRIVIKNYNVPNEFFPGDDFDDSFCTVSEVNLSDAATNNFLHLIDKIRAEKLNTWLKSHKVM